jgi:hypothetical protein
MINITKLRDYAKPGDIILTGTRSKFSLGGLIQFGQRIQTPDKKPSLWKHCLMYVDLYTIAESTIDFKPYKPTRKRMDNGPQYNDIDNLQEEDYALLLSFKDIFDEQRKTMLDTVKEIIESGQYRYDITGLFGSLLTYWIFRWVKSNPFSAKFQLYCSAFVSKILNSIGIDPDEDTDRNTSPERIYQWAERYEGLNFIWL